MRAKHPASVFLFASLFVFFTGCGEGEKTANVVFWETGGSVTYPIVKGTSSFGGDAVKGSVKPDGKELMLKITVKNIGSNSARNIRISHEVALKPYSPTPGSPNQPARCAAKRPFQSLHRERRIPMG